MWPTRKIIQLFVLFLICCVMAKHHKRKRKLARQRVEQNFHEVDALGDDFVDFGAQTGENGQFSWHADFPLE